MDSRNVNRYIREIVRPELKANGFTKFTARNAWRYRENVIDVISFQSFNSYNADVMDVTTYSFSVGLGSFHIDIPTQHSKVKLKSGFLLPEQYQCFFKGCLGRSFLQTELTRNDIWFVKPDGSNIEKCVTDAKHQIIEKGLDWFSQLGTKEALKEILITKKEDMDLLWGFGNQPSPSRSYLLGYVEQLLGNSDLATKHFEDVIESGCFKDLFKTPQEAKDRLRQPTNKD